jgi:deoxyribose-phosphate aldolase
MDLAKYIDHTALKPETTEADVERLCCEAAEHGFAAVCVNPIFVSRAAEFLTGSDVAVASVVGFPLGAATTRAKAFETEDAVRNGAREIDMVIALGWLKDGAWKRVGSDIAEVVKAAGGHPVKVILETCLLSDVEIAEACRVAVESGAAFVKTSTGFGSRGASLEDIAIMKRAAAGRCRIKASGGIRTREQALAMIAAGADRIGTSAGVAIVKGA